MTAETTTSLTNFLNDMLEPITTSFPKRTVLQDELSRNRRRDNFQGDQVRVRWLSAPKQGTGAVSQTGTVNVARQLGDKAAYVKMARITHAIEVSQDLIQAVDAKDFSSAGDALKLELEQAGVSMSRTENEFLNGSGNALIAATTSATTNSTTVVVGAAANFYQLYQDRVVDLIVDPGGTTVSLARTITGVGTTTITVDAAVTATTNTGIFVEGSYGNA